MMFKFCSTLSLCLLVTTNVFALQTYDLVDHQRTVIKISSTELNRIAVEGDRIEQIFGAEGLFHIVTDTQGGQIFLKLMNAFDAKSVSITLITEGGLTHDLKLIPTNVEAQTILFKPKVPTVESLEETGSKPYIPDVVDLITAMHKKSDCPGYKITIFKNSEERGLVEGAVLDPVQLYQGNSYFGYIYQLKNASDETIYLTESGLSEPGDLALCLSSLSLSPNETALLFVVKERTHHG